MYIEAIRKQEHESQTRLVAFIKIDDSKKECWFDYPSEYGKYICTERVDAFVIALIPFAMRKGLDIKSSIPISEKLSYQLHNYYIPILSKYQETFKKIELTCPCASENLNTEGAVGTGISCGIDSFYSVLKHIGIKEKDYELTHLVTMNVGSFGYQGGISPIDGFKKKQKRQGKFRRSSICP